MTKVETEFVAQADQFLQLVLRSFGFRSVSEANPLNRSRPRPIAPLLVQDFRHLSPDERNAIHQGYFGPDGVAYFIALNADTAPTHSHPLFDLAAQLKDDLNLHYPLPHPLEQHPDVLNRFGRVDGTVKVFDFAERSGATGYREQGETSEMFAMHHDGLGSGGTVETAVLYAESGPLSGGYTYFQNILRVSLELARDDPEAFRMLFLPEAVQMIRPRGKGALKVIGPVLYLNEEHSPQSIFRSPSGEYQINWRDDVAALVRARSALEEYARPFAPGSTFLHMSAKGHGCFIRNRDIAHGRTAFINGVDPSHVRVLARKWYMRAQRDAVYKHVPGLFIAPRFAALIPTLFGPDRLEGEWLYDKDGDVNIRKT